MPWLRNKPARTKKALHDAVVRRQVGQSDVLEHADAGDFVVNRFARQIAVVAQLHRDAVLQAFGADARLGVLELPLAQRDAVRVHAVRARSPARQGAPSAPDVEQAFAGPQTQLAADVIELVALRLIERVLGRLEIAARIHALLIEPQPVEGVGHVVVKRDCGAIGLTRMAMRKAAGDARSDRGSCHRAVALGRPQHERIAQQRRLVAPRQRDCFEVVLQPECAVQVALDVDHATDIGVGEQDRIAGEHEPAQHGRIPEYECEAGLVLQRVLLLVSQPQRRRALHAAEQTTQDAKGGRVRCSRRWRRGVRHRFTDIQQLGGRVRATHG